MCTDSHISLCKHSSCLSPRRLMWRKALGFGHQEFTCWCGLVELLPSPRGRWMLSEAMQTENKGSIQENSWLISLGSLPLFGKNGRSRGSTVGASLPMRHEVWVLIADIIFLKLSLVLPHSHKTLAVQADPRYSVNVPERRAGSQMHIMCSFIKFRLFQICRGIAKKNGLELGV